MNFTARQNLPAGPRGASDRLVWFALLLVAVTAHASLPNRLVILLDGVSYRDVKALQEGITETNSGGEVICRRAFDQGFFPVSRLVSTFPSASDVAWTEILGNRPLPGYQRTYLSAATGELVRQNGVTTSMEYELQMHWQVESGLRRALGYVQPRASFKHEIRGMMKAFLQADEGPDDFYALIRATDDAQHTVGNISELLCILDEQLRQLRAEYRRLTGHALEILILSDHGNNHSGAGKRVKIRSFLKSKGYKITDSLRRRHDVVLPTVGIQNWVEVNCLPAEIETLCTLLADLEGVDVVTARMPDHTDQFLVINAEGESAVIDWDRQRDCFRYLPQKGDPLEYQPVIAKLARADQMDANGWAPADDWMKATMTHRYPLALERIARGHTSITLNPAPILIGLRDGYVHCSWLLKQLSSLMRMGGTHGALDARCSNGIVLSSFAPTEDTSTRRVAQQFDGFENLKDPREGTQGADWIYLENPTLASAATAPLQIAQPSVPESEPLLRVWTPLFSDLEPATPVQIAIKPVSRWLRPRVRRSDPVVSKPAQKWGLADPLEFPKLNEYERMYALPEDLSFEPKKTYRITGRAGISGHRRRIFEFTFQTDAYGLPVVR